MLRKTLMIALVVGVGASRAGSEPMDLQDTQARWVSVQFEDSPAGSPGRLDSDYSRPFRAWFEPAANGESARVTVDGEIVERHLFRDEAPVPNSFSDFVWEFDIETGHVTSAHVSGVVLRKLRWGFVRTTAEVEIRVDMSTVRPAGYREPRRLFGNTLYPLCRESGSGDCTLVDPQEFDRGTGYVNAVGMVEVDSVVSRVRTFSPLGEALFTEIPEADVPVLTELSQESVPAVGGGAAETPMPVERALAPVTAAALAPNS